jgi:hypothetical protein
MKLPTTLSTLALLSASASASNFFQQASGSYQYPLEAAGSHVPGESPLEYCSETEGHVLTIEKVDLTPNPPVPGTTLIIQGSGVTHDVIDHGSYCEVTVKYGLITLIRQNIDLCDNADKVDLECPVDQGKVLINKTVDIPSQIPNGKYTVTANCMTPDDRPITCLTGTIVFA